MVGIDTGKILRRLRLCLAGYLASTLAASLGVITGLVALQQLEADSLEDMLRLPGAALKLLIWALPNLLYATIVLTVLPSAVFILVAEFAGLRRWQPYVAFGAALGPAIFFFLGGSVPSGEGLLVMAIAVGAGAFAGFAYWHVAIRWPFSRLTDRTPSTAE